MMDKIGSPTVENLLARSGRTWVEYFEQEIAPRKHFNDAQLVGWKLKEVEEYKELIDAIYLILTSAISSSRKGSLKFWPRSRDSMDAGLDKKVGALLQRLRPLVVFPRRDRTTPRGDSRKMTLVLVEGTSDLSSNNPRPQRLTAARGTRATRELLRGH